MTVEAWGWVFVVVGGLLLWWGFRRAVREVRADMAEHAQLEHQRESFHGYIDPVLDDHHLTVWERQPLYDWAERGDL